jgi:hypothetical protein
MPSTELLIQTDYRAKGPWLIDEKNLLRLDDIVGDFLGAKADGASIKERCLTIFMKAGRRLQKKTFKEVVLDPQFQNETAIGFSYELRVPDCQGSVTIRPTDNNEQELRIKVDPPANRTGQELFLRFQNWATENRPPLPHQVLLAFRPLVLFAFAAWVLVGTLIYAFPSLSANSKQILREEARQLLKDGVTEENQQRALELLLALASDYSVPQNSPPPPRKLSLTFLFVGGILGVLPIVPRICLGIWSGKERLARWRTWLRLITYTIPVLILARYIAPQLFSAIETRLP